MLKHLRFIAVLVLSVIIFGGIQPAFADDNQLGKAASGAILGAIVGGALAFFTAGAALPFVLGGASIGAKWALNDGKITPEDLQNAKVLHDMGVDYNNGQFKQNWNDGTYNQKFWEINAPNGIPCPW